MRSSSKEKGIRETLRQDIMSDDLGSTFARDWKEMKEYFLTYERRKMLSEMGWFKKGFYHLLWLLETLFFRLTPLRRLLFVVSLIILIFGNISFSTSTDGGSSIGLQLNFIPYAIVLFVLMLELKEKLLAKSELSEGRAIQKALLPDSSPDLPEWDIWLYSEPANDVGGDMVDFISVSNSKALVSIADVSGKGLGAALLMAKLQATVRALATERLSLSELGRKLNGIFFRDTLPKSFASLICLEFNQGSDSIKILNAGHMPPFMINKDIIKLDKGEPAIGIIPDVEYTEKTIQMNCGDILLLYSDGVTEARNLNGMFFGEENLIKILENSSFNSAESLGKYVLSKTMQFIDNERVYDDLSLAVIMRK